MGKERKCILCDIVYNSKQEMDEHMRSMLHHRELENIKGRDCDHGCRVCRVSVAGLTAYAGHISSPLHKQRVEEEQERGGGPEEEEYFDKELVQLIEKRKEQIRKEEEAAAKQAQEEEQRKLQQLNAERQWFQQGAPWGWPPPGFPSAPRGPGGANWRGAGDRRNSARGHQGGAWHHPSGGPRTWNQGNQDQSAPWRAEVPPLLQNWGRGGWGGKRGGYQGFSSKKKGGDALYSGFYWDPSATPYLDGMDSALAMDFTSDQLPQSGALDFSRAPHGCPDGPPGWEGGHQARRGAHQSRETPNGDRGKASGSKDRLYRWSPYPPAKLGDAPAQNEEGRSPAATYGTVPSVQVKDLKLKFDFVLGTMQSQDPPGRSQAPPKSKEGPGKKQRQRKAGRVGGGRRDDQIQAAQKPPAPAEPAPEKASSTTSRPVPYQKPSRWDCEFPAPAKLFRRPGLDAGAPPGRRGSADTSAAGARTAPREEEEEEEEGQEAESSECRAGRDWNGRRRNSGVTLPSFGNPGGPRRSSCPRDDSTGSGGPRPAQALSLQSVQVSTSTCDTPERPESPPRAEEEEEEEVEEEAAREGKSDREPTAQATDEGLGSDSDASRPGPAQPAGVPDLSKLGLPASLKRDLTRHMGPKGKAGAHEPNLNIARRIRNLSGARKAEAEKDSGLRPTLRQLISSAGARRNVNWDQVYQEVSRKKQEQEKGMPRFGIEMVTSVPFDPEGLDEGAEDLSEGYHWASICEPLSAVPGAGPRKRSLSESSVVGDRTSSALSLFASPAPPRDRPDGPQGVASRTPGTGAADAEKGAEPGEAIAGSVEGDSSCTSEAELNDAQGLGKKRRAAGEIPSPEIPSLERKNKRMKVKCKKERSQVDQLLAVSLREEELSSSLQAVDSSLIQARAALQAAYMEVQRLLVVKQQVTMEMSTLRSQRIEILQGMQDGYSGSAPPGEKNSSMDTAAAANPAPAPAPAAVPFVAPSTSALLSPFSPNIPAFPPGQSSPALLPPVLQHAAPPASLSPAYPAPAPPHIKQEPTSPSQRSSPAENAHSAPYGTAPEPPLTSSLTEPAQPRSSMFQSLSEPRRASVSSLDSGTVSTESRLDRVREPCCPPQERGVLASRAGSFTVPEKPGAPLSRRRDSQTGAADRTEPPTETSTTGGTFPPPPAEPAVPAPPSPAQTEPRAGKRVRKLKKKRALRKSPGAEQPENSDTEQDGDVSSRPVRRIRCKRKAKGAEQVSTSTPAGAGQAQPQEEEVEEEPRETPPPKPAAEQGGADSDDSSSLEMVELPQPGPLEVVAIDDSSDDETRPVAAETAEAPPAPDALKAEAPNLACDEVSSTSELDTTARTKACASQTQPPPTTVRKAEVNSDVASEAGEEEEPSEGSFEGHQAAVNSLQIHGGQLFTCSGDRTVRAFHLASRKCVAVFEGHSSKVNCLLVSSGPGLQHRLYSGSSDKTIRCYSLKTQECVEQMSVPDRVLCLHSRWKVLYAGLANGNVVSFSLRSNRQLDVFECHGPRAVSCLVSAQEGARRLLLVGSYDCTISVRDAKNGLLLRTLEGHTKTVLCMKVVNDLVFSGSSDQSVQAHNIHTGELVRIYKGHSHAVTVVAILGKVMVTACLDKLVRVYELKSHDRLQVYGGHKDMVMCMAIHKSMIYTGCYDGSVQAVRLNLIQNYRCWWHGCSLIFGVREHLQQHVLSDHASPSFQTLKCRWRNCDAFFTVRNNTHEDVPLHMQSHVEADSKLEP
ncbi:zinc finger protein 106 [Anguilla anguilla]|uniref:zinc finger protein 106 n=1 Tax=Anguilla anguilla TaxID=7936 RepID=UPI0015AE1C59|nr:zinc finger protein 106 [Anguilla anguilla]